MIGGPKDLLLLARACAGYTGRMDTSCGFLEALAARQRFGVRQGLEVMEALLAQMGRPESGLAPIHIAGTNGKGSVAAMTDAVLRAAGWTCGRYTSPHLQRFNERIFVNGEAVADAPLAEAILAVEAAARAAVAAGAEEPTFFECATAAAFEVYRRAGVRLVALETGLGGRLDATNVVTPLVSVITRIGLEHTQWLGETLAAIAGEKAGIIKPGRPVVCGAMPDEARAVVRRRAADLGCRLVDADEAVSVSAVRSRPEGLEARVSTVSRDLGKVVLPLGGLFQAENLATAVAALEAAEEALGLRLPDEAFREGLAGVCWPGRFQLASREPPVIVDGAHNPDCATALRLALKKSGLKGPLGLVAGFCDDKDAGAFLKILASSFTRAWAVTIPSPRAMAGDAVCALMRANGLTARQAELGAALDEARAWALAEGGAVVVCGSLFLAGEALNRLHAFPWPVAAGMADPNEAFTGRAGCELRDTEPPVTGG
jgi:dihydrofolate synthase/folylpolyglutamate synthase